MKNSNLHKAKIAKNDEFYTLYGDIEKELIYYHGYLKGKIVYCNCDNPYNSNFVSYFINNFNSIGLKALYISNYSRTEKNYKVIIREVRDNSLTKVTFEEPTKNHKEIISNGSFDSKDVADLLEESDVVITNPPFSLFNEYFTFLINKGKKFIIIGDKNKITNKNIFYCIKHNKFWIGHTLPSGFIQPDDKEHKKMAGRVYWFTNVGEQSLKKELRLTKLYKGNEEKYPIFDNYNAINIDKVSDIPADYEGVMGVPVTFLRNYNPSQFEIIGCGCDIKWAETCCEFFTPPTKEKAEEYKSRKKPWRVQNPYIIEKDGNIKMIYSRVFIKRKGE